MNILSAQKRALALHCLVEGNSIRATGRLTNTAKDTVMSLVGRAGMACTRFQDQMFHDLPCRKMQCDELWSYVFCKDKHLLNGVSRLAPSIRGTVWTWVVMCADTKLVPTWITGDRTTETALELMLDLKHRLLYRIQLTTDGLSAYREAVEIVFGSNIDFAQLVKQYSQMGGDEGEQRNGEVYNETQEFLRKDIFIGSPDEGDISTSYVERQNLTQRMGNRRFTRRTNGYSKRVENHAHQIALHFWYYNFARIHESLRVTPAMEAGVTDRLWDFNDLVKLIEADDPVHGPRGPYRKRKVMKDLEPTLPDRLKDSELVASNADDEDVPILVSQALLGSPKKPPKGPGGSKRARGSAEMSFLLQLERELEAIEAGAQKVGKRKKRRKTGKRARKAAERRVY